MLIRQKAAGRSSVIEVRGLNNQYLEIDLSSQTWDVFTTDRALCTSYLGGKGMALKLLHDRFERFKDADALEEQNILCFSMGAFLGTGASCSARFNGTAKSPLTGIMTSSSCGGPFGEACRTAGWDGLLISGKASSPVVLRIDEEGVKFEDAGSLWGLDTEETRKALNLTPREGELIIGPAGENLVRYANIRSGNRYLGRGGLGAVMGSKRLKAVVARGRSHVMLPVDPKLFEKTRKKSLAYVKRNAFSRLYRLYGTNAVTRLGRDAGFAPVYNFRDRAHKDIDKLYGETMAQQYRTEHSGCRYCTVLCGHAGTFPDGKKHHIPEYETTGMFGSNIGNFDTHLITQWNDQMNRYGMDTISAGGTIAWAMEAAQRGIRNSELRFNHFESVSKVLEDIAYLRDEGQELSRGTKWLSSVYGGDSFACHVKGLEMAAYDPRAAWGHGLGYAVANRGGCHLGSYLVGPEAVFRLLKPYTAKSKAFWVIFFENLFSAVNSLQTCLFTTFSVIMEPPAARFTPRPVLGFIMLHAPSLAASLMDWSILSDYWRAITGYPMTMQSLLEAGERIQVLERMMNIQMGVTAKDDTLPERFTADGETMHKRRSVVPVKQMTAQYYQLRGYDEYGMVKPETLKRLGI